MKICFIAAANSIHSKKWVAYFAQAGHEVHWISLVPSNQGEIAGVKFYEFKGNLLLNALRIKKLIKKISPNILHAHYVGKNGFVGAFSGFRPLVLTAWGDDIIFSPKSLIKGPFVKKALRKADLITCDAQHMKDAMVKLGVPQDKIKIIYFGIDTKKFSPRPPDEKLINTLGLTGRKIVISMRNFDPIYNLETLIRTVSLVAQAVPEVKFLVVGTGPQEEMLKSLAVSLGVEKITEFTGRLKNDDIPRYLNIADIYVSTSLSDAGIAASTAEAMSSGVPVVVTDSGENSKWIIDGRDGFLVPVKDSQALAERIIKLLGDEEKRNQFAKFGREVIVERNDYYREMKKMEDIYQSLVDKS